MIESVSRSNDEVVARRLDLTGVAGEEPPATPDTLEVELVDAGIGLELALERVARRVLRDQTLEQRARRRRAVRT